jgi:hypothetical protein
MFKLPGLFAYCILLALVGIALAVFGSPNFTLAIAFLTLGLGVILVALLANVFVFLVALLPMVLLGVGGNVKRGGIGLVVGMIGYGAFLFGPGYFAEQELSEVRATLSQRNIKKPLDVKKLRSFELQYVANTGLATCEANCRSLLVGGFADWVRIQLIKKTRDGTYELVAGAEVFENAQGEACVGGASPCIVVAQDTSERADLLARKTDLQKEIIRPLTSGLKYSEVRGGRQIELIFGSSTAERVVYRKASYESRAVTSPTRIFPGFEGMESAGYELMMSRFAGEELSLSSSFREVGFDLKDIAARFEKGKTKNYQRLPTATEVSLVERALEQSGEQGISDGGQRAISDYVTKARWFEVLPDVHLDLMERIVKDDRITGVHNVDQVFRYDPAFRAHMLPWIFESLESNRAGSRKMWSQIGVALKYHYTPDELAPYRERYLTFYTEKRLGLHMTDLLGRWNVDPSDQFDASFSSTKDGLERAIYAFCYSDPIWYETLSGSLLALFKATEAENNRLRYPFDKAGSVLASVGHYDDVAAEYTRRKWASEKTMKYLKRLASQGERSSRAHCS